MHEVLPVALGALTGLGTPLLVRGRTAWVVLTALSLIIGVIASAVSGELALSWGFVPVDAVQSLLAAAVTMAGISVLRQRNPLHRRRS